MGEYVLDILSFTEAYCSLDRLNKVTKKNNLIEAIEAF